MEDGRDFFAFVALIIIIIFLFLQIHTSPILDRPDKPFIVKKIKESNLNAGYNKYYGKAQGNTAMFPPKPLIFKRGTYNVGDTIYFGRK